MKTWTRFLGVLALVASTLAWGQSSPDALVRSTVEEVLTVMRQNKDPERLRELAEQKVLPNFDFERMTRLAVGRAWQNANPSQRDALVTGFRSLLITTYSAALSNGITPAEKIDVKPAQGSGSDVVVKTIAHRAGKQPVVVDYRVAKQADSWKVYDVIAEGISLVLTYRGTFAAEIARSGVDGLIRVLEERSGKQAS
jgi:phospholipid transport system substrate-binding protein